MTPRLIGVCLLSASAVLYLIFVLSFEHLLGVAIHFSPDRQITAEGERQLASALLFLTASCALAGIVAWRVGDDSGWAALRRDVWSDHGLTPHASPLVTLIVWTALGLFLVAHINLYSPVSSTFAAFYFEDGVFETLTVVALLAAAACLAVALRRFRREPRPRWLGGWGRAALAAFMAILLIWAGEEISWGQRLLGWPTPSWLPANTQNETNIHNYFTSELPPIYRLFVLLPVPLLIAAWLAHSRRLQHGAMLLLPHPSLLGLSLLIAFVAVVRPEEQELLEEMLALFALAHSLRILRLSRSAAAVTEIAPPRNRARGRYRARREIRARTAARDDHRG